MAITPERLRLIRSGEIYGQIETPYLSRDAAIDDLVVDLIRQGKGASAVLVRRMQIDIRDLAEALVEALGDQAATDGS